MKCTKPKLPVPLVDGALIARREITLGLGHTALVEICYDGPNKAAPETGAEWPPETDWPAARLRLSLPNSHGYAVHSDLECPVTVLDAPLQDVIGSSQTWGSGYSTPIRKTWRHRRKAGTSLRQLAAEMLREVIAELRPVQAHLKARAARLAQREATLNAGLDARPIREPAQPAG